MIPILLLSFLTLILPGFGFSYNLKSATSLILTSIFIIFSYIGNGDNFSTTKQINISTFEKYLNASEVSKVTIINKTLAEVTLTENALLNEIHRDVSKTNLIVALLFEI